MDERDVAELFIEEMSQLLATMRGQLHELTWPVGPSQGARWHEFLRVVAALFDLCATFELDDCALICRALGSLPSESIARPAATMRALTTEAQAFLERRLEQISSARALSPASPADLARARELASAVRGQEQTTGSLTISYTGRNERTDASARGAPTEWNIITADDALATDAADEPLTEAEKELVARFQVSTLRTGPDTRSIPSDERQGDAAGDDVAARGAPVAQNASVLSPLDENHGTVEPGSVPAAPVLRVSPTPEELDAIPPEMKRLFLVETAEDLQDMRVALLKLGEMPDDVAALHAMRRIAHKIRGSAGTLQYPQCEQIVLVYEDLLKTVQQSGLPAAPSAHSILLRGLVILQSALVTAESAGDADEGLIGQANALVHELRLTIRQVAPSPVAAPHPSPAPSGDTATVADVSARLLGSSESESSLRVDVRRLDALIRHATELTINRAGISHHIEDVARLQAEVDQSIARLHQLNGLLTDAPTLLTSQRHAAGMSDTLSAQRPSPWAGLRRAPMSGSGPGQRVRWDELELERLTETDDALRALAEAISDLSANASSLKLALTQLSRLSLAQAELAAEIQRDVMQVRLVPLSELVPRLRLEVKSLAPLVQKDVVFRVRGESTHIDRNISDALADPLIQLVRNAVTHGIEAPEERVERGKPPTGDVWMNAYYVGSEVVIEIGDDGGGVNPNQLAYRAVFAGLLDEATVRDMSPQEKLDLMFLPGLTQLPQAGALGGQGIGLYGVQAQIEELKGSIQARSEPGSGTVFRVRVPISLSVVSAVHARVGGETFAVPVSAVQRFEEVHPLDILTSTEQSASASRPGFARPARHLRLNATKSATGDALYEDVPLVSLAELLGLDSEPPQQQVALIVEIGRRHVGVLVDGDAGQSEVVVQALPPHLRRRAVRGATVTPDGHVRLVLDLPELIAEAEQTKGATQTPRLRPAPRLTRALAPRVLVVDDSVSIRKTLEGILSRAHFEVQLARDGVEALEMMLVSPPRVIVLDIEMPRLDGFELLTMMRETPLFEHVRVVMLTSRASDKHRLHAQALGASAYLVKPCPQEILIDTVRGLLEEQPAN